MNNAVHYSYSAKWECRECKVYAVHTMARYGMVWCGGASIVLSMVVSMEGEGSGEYQ